MRKTLSRAVPGYNPISSTDSTIKADTSSAAPSVNNQNHAVESAEDDSASDAELAKRKYVLQVTAGSSYDPRTHQVVQINGTKALHIENQHMNILLKVRIRDYIGLPRSSPSSTPYFMDANRKNDQYSIAFDFVPKVDLPSEHLVWGNDFDHPVRDRLPPGFNTAFKIVKNLADPGLECDAYADEPWLYGPALSSWFTLRVGEKCEPEKLFAKPQPGSFGEEEYVVEEGGDGSGKELREAMGISENPSKRRKFFLDASRRQQFIFEKDRRYHADFYNPYLDFNKFALKLPGFSLSVLRYIDDKSHALRHVFKNRETGEVYLCVVMNLLFGDELQKAIDNDKSYINNLD